MLKKIIYSQIKLLFQRKTKYTIKTIINKRTFFEGKNKVGAGDYSNSFFGFGSVSASSLPNCKIGKYSSIGRDCHIVPAFHDYKNFSTSSIFFKSQIIKTQNGYYAEIGNDVWIGSNVLIKGGVVIGDGAVVGMGSIVLKDVPPYSIVAGVPARIIRMRFNETQILKLLKMKWWDKQFSLIREMSRYKCVDEFISESRRENNEK